MNKAFDYNGVLVSASNPVKQLRLITKTLLLDSADRDTKKYYTNGDVVYYLPRVYENVVSIRLKSAIFPTPIVNQETSPSSGTRSFTHVYSSGQNIPTASWSGDSAVSAVNYFLIDIEGLNKNDETVVGAQKSSYTDNFFARIPIALSQVDAATYAIVYNDNSYEENIGRYSPPIGKLDRLHVVTRLHSQQNKSGFIYWTTDGATAGDANRTADYSLVLELEMLDNGFDGFSSFETRIH